MSERFRVVGVDELPDEIKARVECGYNTYAALVEFDGDRIVDVVAWDGGEPEDQTLWRDWSWIAPWASGIADALAREKARADEAEAQAAAMRDWCAAWLRRAVAALFREGWEEGMTEREATDALVDVLANLGCDDGTGEPSQVIEAARLDALPISHAPPESGRALLAERDRLREVLQEALPFIEHAAREDVNYGYPVVEDPRDFSPDPECCNPEEIAAHKAACEAWERGERPTREPTHETIADGETLIRLTRAPWGIGVSTLRDPQAVALLAQVRAALSGERDGEGA